MWPPFPNARGSTRGRPHRASPTRLMRDVIALSDRRRCRKGRVHRTCTGERCPTPPRVPSLALLELDPHALQGLVGADLELVEAPGLEPLDHELEGVQRVGMPLDRTGHRKETGGRIERIEVNSTTTTPIGCAHDQVSFQNDFGAPNGFALRRENAPGHRCRHPVSRAERRQMASLHPIRRSRRRQSGGDCGWMSVLAVSVPAAGEGALGFELGLKFIGIWDLGFGIFRRSLPRASSARRARPRPRASRPRRGPPRRASPGARP
jgi:hypothetical protein